MKNKVLLISIDGMRSDGLKACGNPYVKELEKRSYYTYNARSMEPSVTLPCHFSMAHSVIPQRHGILTNTYVPQVRPVKGIFEKVADAGGVCAMFYGWEPLRDICVPGALKYAIYVNDYMQESGDTVLADACEAVLSERKPDLAFLYMVETDQKGGHDYGWMSEEYLGRISIAIDHVKRMIEKFGDEYSVIVMSDHGGHDRSHGSTLPEDMTVPLFFCGKEFPKGEEIEGDISLLEIAPTISKILDIPADAEWEGKPVF